MRLRVRALAIAALGLLACEGGGDAGKGLVIEHEPIAPNCTPLAGTFPSGLALLPQSSHRAALVQTRCGSPSEAAPRTSDDGDAPCKISVSHAENCSPCLSSAHVHEQRSEQF